MTQTAITTHATGKSLDELVANAEAILGPLFGAEAAWRVVKVEAEPVVADGEGYRAWQGEVTAEVANGKEYG
jgi:hypothetical protein